MATRRVEQGDPGPPSPSIDRGEERDRPSRTRLLIAVVSGAALVVALGLVLVTRSDDGGSGIGSNSVATDPTTVVTSAPQMTATTATSSTTAVDDSPATTVSIPPSTIASMSPPSAVPEPTPAPTVPPPPPPPPTQPTGTAVLDDPLPSGLPSADVAASLALAQRLGAALAAGDWEAARQLNPALRSLTDAQFESGYGGLDRSAQLLVDARRTDGADRLLVVTIANEHGGAQTSLYCIESTVSAGGEVRQTSTATLDRYAGTLGIEDVTGDPVIRDLIRAECTLQ